MQLLQKKRPETADGSTGILERSGREECRACVRGIIPLEPGGALYGGPLRSEAHRIALKRSKEGEAFASSGPSKVARGKKP